LNRFTAHFLKFLIADDPESVIVAIARRLDEGRFPISQVGIQFVQVRIPSFKALQVVDPSRLEMTQKRLRPCGSLTMIWQEDINAG